MILKYNQRTADVPFKQWLEDNGIEIVDGWDAGMYGNIGYIVRKDGVEYKATGYQSIGVHGGNFTFDLIV